MGALAAVDARAESLWGGAPDVPMVWRRPLDDFLVSCACRVFEAVPFALAAIGFEISGTIRREDFAHRPEAARGRTLLWSELGELVRIDPPV